MSRSSIPKQMLSKKKKKKCKKPANYTKWMPSKFALNFFINSETSEAVSAINCTEIHKIQLVPVFKRREEKKKTIALNSDKPGNIHTNKTIFRLLKTWSSKSAVSRRQHSWVILDNQKAVNAQEYFKGRQQYLQNRHSNLLIPFCKNTISDSNQLNFHIKWKGPCSMSQITKRPKSAMTCKMNCLSALITDCNESLPRHTDTQTIIFYLRTMLRAIKTQLCP